MEQPEMVNDQIKADIDNDQNVEQQNDQNVEQQNDQNVEQTNDQNVEQNNEQQNEQIAEQQYEEPPKQYEPPNPTLEDCVKLNGLLPTHMMEKNIEALSTVLYDYDDIFNEFLQRVDKRTNINQDSECGPFISCEQCRDGDSYRSPLSNKYYPPIEGGRYPSPELRKFEIALNTAFKEYVKNYYSSNTLYSCYCWDLGDKIEDGFGVAVLIKKTEKESSWDSINIMNVEFEKTNKIECTYSLITDIKICIQLDRPNSGKLKYSGTIQKSSKKVKQLKKYLDIQEQLPEIGSMIEKQETELRGTFNGISINKSKEIINNSRYPPKYGKPSQNPANALRMAFMAMKK